jgi:crotonobetainyl-CoA:carnitine CoA-transferase CaiB-like acyl-CoA transferase
MRPLGDVRVVAIEQYGAGPFGSLHLAELGAEVIKVEDPATGGDVGRYVPPFQEGEDSLFFQTFNRNKRSVSLDLRTPAGREVLEDLVRRSDALYSNLRGDLPERLRIRYEDLRHLNPRIVCCSLTGFGTTGSRRADPGYDYLLQGLAGWMWLTGEPDGPPEKTGPSLVDYAGGLVAALALLAGVHAARRDGRGMDCDVSLFDTAVALLGYVATWWLTAGYEVRRTRSSAHPSLVPFQTFATADGFVVVACPKDKFFERLAGAVGRPELATDPRFSGFEGRRRHAEELLSLLADAFGARSTEEWLRRLAAAGVPAAPVRGIPEALSDPALAERGLVVETSHPRFGRVRAPASPVRVGEPPAAHRPAPARGADAAYVLSDLLGYDDERVEALRRAGAFG